MSGKKHIEMFRVKVHSARQRLLMSSSAALDHSGRIQAVVACVANHPALIGGDGAVLWQVGEVTPFSRVEGDARMAFQFGKPSVDEEVTRFDENTKSYAPKKIQLSPYIMIYMDMREGEQILGIEPPDRHKHLAPKAVKVADALQQTLNQCLADKGVETNIDPIYDPSEFKQKLAAAYAVTALAVSFGRPNHTLDAGKLRDVTAEIVDEIGAETSESIFKSEKSGSIRPEKASDFVDTAASGGFPVWAKVKDGPKDRPKKIEPNKRQVEKLPVDEGEESGTILRKIAEWFSSKKGRRGKS